MTQVSWPHLDWVVWTPRFAALKRAMRRLIWSALIPIGLAVLHVIWLRDGSAESVPSR